MFTIYTDLFQSTQSFPLTKELFFMVYVSESYTVIKCLLLLIYVGPYGPFTILGRVSCLCKTKVMVFSFFIDLCQSSQVFHLPRVSYQGCLN